jgi:hypothetical protein
MVHKPIKTQQLYSCAPHFTRVPPILLTHPPISRAPPSFGGTSHPGVREKFGGCIRNWGCTRIRYITAADDSNASDAATQARDPAFGGAIEAARDPASVNVVMPAVRSRSLFSFMRGNRKTN